MSLPPDSSTSFAPASRWRSSSGARSTWDPRKSNPARGDYWAPCPFHQEKTASFHVDETKGYYYCFGCHAKGDAVTFLRETENLGFIEAVERLAARGRHGDARPRPGRRRARRRRPGPRRGDGGGGPLLPRCSSAAPAPPRRAPISTAAASAPATRERFEIGFAPDSRTALLEHLTGKGFARDRLAEAGLIGLPRDGGSPYDRFRGRIIFPIRDARGRAIAFGARAHRRRARSRST